MNLELGETVRIFTRTLPFAVVRTGINLAFAVAALLYLAVIVGLAFLFTKIGGNAGGLVAVVVVIAGLGGGYGLILLARSWILYLVEAAHVAVVTAYLTDGKLPEGESQYSIGKRLVTERFVDLNLLFVIDELVQASTREVNRLVEDIAEMIPIPGFESLAGFVERVIAMAMNFIDETVLSYSLYKHEKNVWQSAAEGIVLYAQSYKSVLANAVAMAILAWASFGALVVILGIFFWPIAYSMGTGHGIIQAVFFLAPFVFGYVLKLSLVNPFVMISVLVTFYKHAVGQPVSQEWVARLEGVSAKFRELRNKASSHGTKPAAS
jgi:hypothetical protein